MREHREDFAPFIEEDEQGQAVDFEEYCHEVESTAAWGGQLELGALATALQKHIKVYAVGMPVVEVLTKNLVVVSRFRCLALCGLIC